MYIVRNKIEEKVKVWGEIIDHVDWLNLDIIKVAGDFNAILDIDEKLGGLRKSSKVMESFKDFIKSIKVEDVIPKNGLYTWTNRRIFFSKIFERLDSFFVGDFWINGQFFVSTVIIPQVGSDHLLVLLSLDQDKTIRRSYFKFIIMWWRDPNFKINLKRWWEQGNKFAGSPSFCFAKKMKYMKQKNKIWNKVSFKNIFAEKLRIEELESINEKVMIAGMTNEKFTLESKLKVEYMEILKREELYWRDKSKELWVA